MRLRITMILFSLLGCINKLEVKVKIFEEGDVGGGVLSLMKDCNCLTYF